MRFQGCFWGVLAAAFAAVSVCAQSLPPLQRQQDWTDQDKRTFLRYLDSNRPMPTSDVRGVSAGSWGKWSDHPAWALELGPASTTLFPVSASGNGPAAQGLLGARALYERHLAPWLRVYAGLEAEPLRQTSRDGSSADLTRWAIPLGFEFALVPLATPQTRCVLLRAGIAASEVSGAPSSEFSRSLVGASAAWNLGLGYEWQIPDSRWRLNAAIDGLRSMGSRAGVGYYGLGLSAALVRTF